MRQQENICSYVLLSCFYLFDNMSTGLSRDSAIREPWRTCTEIRESRALCREQRVSVSCLLCAMVPGRKAALAASGEGECKFGACPVCRFDIFLLATGTCQIEKKRCFQQSVFPFSGRLSGSLRSFIFFWAEKKSVFSAKRKIFLMRVILNRA